MSRFASPQGYENVRAYFTRPADAKGKLPGVLVVHEKPAASILILRTVSRRLGRRRLSLVGAG